MKTNALILSYVCFVCPNIKDVEDFLFNLYLPGCINSAIHNYSSQRHYG